MLSTSCKYALRATVYLMSQAGKLRKSGIKEIAEEIQANEHTTGKILQLLVKEGIISSSKGPNGGFFMERGGKPVYLIDVVKVVDGLHMFFDCGLGLKKCSDRKPCPIHQSFKAVRETLHHEFCTVTIQDLATDIEQGMAYLRR